MKYLRLDSQILTSISHCPLRAKYTFIERLKSKEDHTPFQMGTGVHTAAESYYKDLKLSVPFKERIEKALLLSNTWMATESSLSQEEITTVLRTMNDYFTYRKEDPIYVQEVEVFFSKVLFVGKDLFDDDITILYEGKIDLIADESDRITRVYDHKSTNRNFTPVDMRVQFLGYCWATGHSVVENRIGFQSSLKPEAKFVRFPYKYRPELIAEWQDFAIRKALEYGYYLQTEKFPPNFGACEGKFGYPCNYIDLCRFPELIDETKEYQFKIGEPWDPLKEKNT